MTGPRNMYMRVIERQARLLQMILLFFVSYLYPNMLRYEIGDAEEVPSASKAIASSLSLSWHLCSSLLQCASLVADVGL